MLELVRVRYLAQTAAALHNFGCSAFSRYLTNSDSLWDHTTKTPSFPARATEGICALCCQQILDKPAAIAYDPYAVDKSGREVASKEPMRKGGELEQEGMHLPSRTQAGED